MGARHQRISRFPANVVTTSTIAQMTMPTTLRYHLAGQKTASTSLTPSIEAGRTDQYRSALAVDKPHILTYRTLVMPPVEASSEASTADRH